MNFVHICSAIVICFGFIELILTLRFLLFQCDSKTTPIYKGACIAWLPLGVFIVMDAVMMIIIFSSYSNPASLNTVLLFLFLHKATLIIKSFVVLFLGCVILWRLIVFYGKKSSPFLVHLVIFVLFLGAYWTGAIITVLQTSNLKRPIGFAVFLFGINAPSDITPDAIPRIMKAIKGIFIVFQAAFVLETILLLGGTFLFLFSIAKATERTKYETIVVFVFSREGCRLVIITLLSIIKIVLFSFCDEVNYISMLVFFFSSIQYPMELHLFLQTSYHTSRHLIKQQGSIEQVETFKPQYTLTINESFMNSPKV